jgi:membrane associated rhomboid family serine protease
MPRSNPVMLSFPPFAGVIRRIILAILGVFFLLLLLHWVSPSLGAAIFANTALTPFMVMHGAVWQIATYSFLTGGIFQTAFALLSLWLIGAYLETSYGGRWVAELYFIAVLGAAITTIAISYTGLFHMRPTLTTYGPDGGIFGLLTAWAVLMGDQSFILFPLPISIRAKYLVAIYIVVALAGIISGPSGFAYIGYLGGALAGYLYVKRAPRRGYAFAASERAYSLRNAYYRWKRKRAARKFEVYMRKHDKLEGRVSDADRNRDPNDRHWMN